MTRPSTDLAFRTRDLQERADRQRLVAREYEAFGEPLMATVMHGVADRTLLDAARYAARAGLTALLIGMFGACALTEAAVGYDEPKAARVPSSAPEIEVVLVPELAAVTCLVEHTLSAQTWTCTDHAYAPGAFEPDPEAGWVQQFECFSDDGGAVTLGDCYGTTDAGESVTRCDITGDVQGYVRIGATEALFKSTFGPITCPLSPASPK